MYGRFIQNVPGKTVRDFTVCLSIDFRHLKFHLWVDPRLLPWNSP